MPNPLSYADSVGRAASDSAVQFQKAVLYDQGIILTHLLGSGGQGSVYRGILKGSSFYSDDAVPVAVKIVKKKPGCSKDLKRVEMHIQREIEILEAIDHDRCLKFYQAFEDDEAWYLVSEFLNGVDLFEQATRRVFSDHEILTIMLEVLQALEYLHSLGIAHRDIKLENIMFVHNIESRPTALDIKVIDFGLAYYEEFDRLEFRANDSLGTPKYKPPEMLQKAPYDPRKIDIWAVGVMMYILCTGEFPFDASNENDVLFKIIHKREAYNQQCWRCVSKETQAIIKDLLDKDAERRLGATEAIVEIEAVLKAKQRAALSSSGKPAMSAGCKQQNQQGVPIPVQKASNIVPAPAPAPAPASAAAPESSSRVSSFSAKRMGLVSIISTPDKAEKQRSGLKPAGLVDRLTQALRM